MLARAESEYEDPFDNLGAEEDRSGTHQHIGAERGVALLINESAHTRSLERFLIVVGSKEHNNHPPISAHMHNLSGLDSRRPFEIKDLNDDNHRTVHAALGVLNPAWDCHGLS